MKITQIETIALQDPGKAIATIVRVHTDEGTTGIGQAESPSLIIDAIIRCEGGLQQVLQGENPLEVERLWQKMYAATGLFGRRGVTIAAIGAVETALWDIAGKVLKKPVCELIWRSLGTTDIVHVEVQVDRQRSGDDHNRIKSHITPYATVYPPGGDLAETTARFRQAADNGFRAVKLEEWPGMFGQGDIKTDVAVVQAVRRAIGDDRDLMIDVANRWQDVGQAVATIRAIEPYRIFFVEAPLPPDNLEAHARLADAVDTRIAAGDWGFTSRFEFEELMVRGRVDVVQPSSVRSGGISEIMKIAESAYRRGLLCVPHAWCHMIGVAASVHLAAALPHMPYIEYGVAIPSSPILTDLLEPRLAPNADGLIEVPRRPGLGFTLNEDVVQRYRVKPF